MNKSFRICIFVNSLSGGGGETVALMLYRAFKMQGMDVLLLCIERNDMLDVADIDVHYLSDASGNESGIMKILLLPVLAMRLKRFIQSNHIELVQSHIYRANYINVLARLFGSKHKLQIVNHGIAGRYKKMGLLGKVNLALIRFLYPRADQLLCPSTGMMNDLVRCGVPAEKMHRVPNPFSLGDIKNAAKEKLPDDYLARVANRKVIIAVGRFEAVKKTLDILQAFKLLHEKNKSVRLVLVGDGSERSMLEKFIADNDLTEGVILTGYVSNPFRYIAQASMLVTASEYEGFSNVIVEALVLGIPVISSDCPGGPREILSAVYDGSVTISAGKFDVMEYGLLVPVGDVTALKKAMSRVLEDERLRENFVAKSQQRAADFAIDKIVQQHLKLISQSLNKM